MLAQGAAATMLSQSRAGDHTHGDKMPYARCAFCDMKERLMGYR